MVKRPMTRSLFYWQKAMKLIFGLKQSITQIWDSTGRRLPASVISAGPMLVTQVKHLEVDGYEAIQVGFGKKSVKNLTNPEKKHLQKASDQIIPRYLKEIRLEEPGTYTLGDLIKPVDLLHEGDLCAVRGLSKGRGFSGVMKRHGFKGGPKTHGQSDRARAPGSIGQGTDPGRVHKGKKMAGHFGHEIKWLKNVTIVKVDTEKNEIWLKGPIPGARNSVITLEILTSKLVEEVKA